MAGHQRGQTEAVVMQFLLFVLQVVLLLVLLFGVDW